MHNFCPKCGSTQGQFIKAFCMNCFLEDHQVIQIDSEIKLEHCNRCGKIRVKGDWLAQSDSTIKEFLEKTIKLKDLINPEIETELTPADKGTTQALITVTGKLFGQEVELKKLVLLTPKSGICDPCMRVTSNYHEAILQLRFPEKPSEKQIKEKLQEINFFLSFEQAQDSLAQIVDYTRVPKGIDVLIGSKRAGRVVAEKLSKKTPFKVVASYTLIGIDKSGKNKIRHTYCVRF